MRSAWQQALNLLACKAQTNTQHRGMLTQGLQGSIIISMAISKPVTGPIKSQKRHQQNARCYFRRRCGRFANSKIPALQCRPRLPVPEHQGTLLPSHRRQRTSSACCTPLLQQRNRTQLRFMRPITCDDLIFLQDNALRKKACHRMRRLVSSISIHGSALLLGPVPEGRFTPVRGVRGLLVHACTQKTKSGAAQAVGKKYPHRTW